MANKNAKGNPNWVKGHSGGPGRPPGSKNGSSRAIEWAEKYGWDFMCDVAMGKPVFEREIKTKDGERVIEKHSGGETTRTDIAKYLLDRAYGRPSQSVDANISGSLAPMEIVVGMAQVFLEKKKAENAIAEGTGD